MTIWPSMRSFLMAASSSRTPGANLNLLGLFCDVIDDVVVLLAVVDLFLNIDPAPLPLIKPFSVEDPIKDFLDLFPSLDDLLCCWLLDCCCCCCCCWRAYCFSRWLYALSCWARRFLASLRRSASCIFSTWTSSEMSSSWLDDITTLTSSVWNALFEMTTKCRRYSHGATSFRCESVTMGDWSARIAATEIINICDDYNVINALNYV